MYAPTIDKYSSHTQESNKIPKQKVRCIYRPTQDM